MLEIPSRQSLRDEVHPKNPSTRLSSGLALAAGLSLATSLTLSGCAGEPDSGPPNIIFFYVDDMGWQDTSVPFWTERTHFNDLYRTPNMERLAEQGMIFTQAYATAVCSPSRTSLMTGMNAARHGVTNWTLNRDTFQDGRDPNLTFPIWNMNGLQPTDTIPNSVYADNLVQLLRDNGYYNIFSGKAHLGVRNSPGEDPLNLGFHVNIAGHAAGGPGSFSGLRNFGNNEDGSRAYPWGVPGLEKYHGQDINLTDAITLEALKAMDVPRKAGQPFYMYMSHYTVHVPLEAHHPYYDRYKEMGLDEREARYASMVEGMDASLGAFMDYLEEYDLVDNTVLIFKSDNGGLSAHGRGGVRHTHNYPLSSGKGSAHEGGIRVPMIVAWPGVTEPGSVSNDYMIIEDIFPTVLEMARIEDYEVMQTLDGRSFVPQLRQEGSSAEERSLFWHYPNNWGPSGPGIGTYSTIRSGDWKLIYYYSNQSFELFNIAEDIGEQNNLAGEMPQMLTELASELGAYLREVEAFRPTFTATGELVPWPDEI